VGVQVPAVPGWLQDSHVPLQAVAQQAPSTQKPVAHSLPSAQAPPDTLRGVHAPPRQ